MKHKATAYLMPLRISSDRLPVHNSLSLQLPAAAGAQVSSCSRRERLLLAEGPRLDASSAICNPHHLSKGNRGSMQ